MALASPVPSEAELAHYLENHAGDHQEYVERLAKAGISSNIFSRFDLLGEEGDSTHFAEAFHLNAEGQAVFSELFYGLSRQPHETFSVEYEWFRR